MEPGLEIFEERNAESPWFSEVLELFESTQGRKICSLDYLKRAATSPREVLFIATCKGELAGAMAGKIIDEFSYYAPFGSSLAKDWQEETVGSLATVSVSEQFRGKGYGRALCQQTIGWLKARGCTMIISVSWRNGTPHNSARVFESLGMTQVAEVGDFYVPWSIKINLECPVCSKPPCRCAAVLYQSRL